VSGLTMTRTSFQPEPAEYDPEGSLERSESWLLLALRVDGQLLAKGEFDDRLLVAASKEREDRAEQCRDHGQESFHDMGILHESLIWQQSDSALKLAVSFTIGRRRGPPNPGGPILRTHRSSDLRWRARQEELARPESQDRPAIAPTHKGALVDFNLDPGVACIRWVREEGIGHGIGCRLRSLVPPLFHLPCRNRLVLACSRMARFPTVTDERRHVHLIPLW
jgi:hypothetical protein